MALLRASGINRKNRHGLLNDILPTCLFSLNDYIFVPSTGILTAKRKETYINNKRDGIQKHMKLCKSRSS